jgi:hypothetical protein
MSWFRRPTDGQPVLVPDYMVDTVARLRREGWAELPVLDTPETPAPLPAIVEAVDTDPDRTEAIQQERHVEAVKAVQARNASARKWIEGKR